VHPNSAPRAKIDYQKLAPYIAPAEPAGFSLVRSSTDDIGRPLTEASLGVMSCAFGRGRRAAADLQCSDAIYSASW
jgi:hypothetical protein